MFKEASLSLVDFHSQLQGYWRDMKQGWDAISYARSLFDEEEDVYAVHCDHVKNALRIVREPVWEFYRLLNTSSRLPMTVVPHCFSLLNTLRQVEDLVDELMILMTLFQRICRTTSRDMIERRQEIRHNLDRLVQGYEDILQQIDQLLLQVLSQERAERQKLKSINIYE